MREFFVDVIGNDGGDGTREHPFTTPHRARNAARELRKGGYDGDITVWLRGGKYYLTHPVMLIEEDAGSGKGALTFAACPGETPVLSGGRPVTGWRPFRDGIFVADVPEARTGYFTRQLFYNGVRQTRARFPKADPDNRRVTGWNFVESSAYINAADDDGKRVGYNWALFSHTDFSRCFQFRAGDVRRYADPRKCEITLSPMLGWFTLRNKVQSVDYERCVVTLAKPLPDYKRLPWTNDVIICENNRYFVENALEDLTQPGEWVLDWAEGKVYFMPPGGKIEDGSVVLPVIPTIFDIHLSGHINLDGLTFTETLDCGDDWHREGNYGYGAMFPHQGNAYCGEAVHILDSSFCSVRNCGFMYTGGNGLYIEGECVCCAAERNEFAYVGTNPVSVMGNEVRHPKNTRIINNNIHDGGEVLNYVAGVFLGACDGTTVAHNRIHDMPHHGINLATYSFGRNLIEYNDIRRVTLEINDTGAINCWMDGPGECHVMLPNFARAGHIIRYNWISDIRGCKVSEDGKLVPTEDTRGIYLDDGSGNCMVYGNAVVRCQCGMLLHCGIHNYVENNLFIDCKIGINIGDGVSSRVGNEANIGYQRGHHFERNAFVTSEEDPMLYTIHKWSPILLHCCDDNLIFSTHPYRICSSNDGPDHGKFITQTLVQWQERGFDTRSVTADPCFADPANDDYRLRPESPLLKLGFIQPPFEKMGIEK